MSAPVTNKTAFIGAFEDWFLAMSQSPRYAEKGAEIAAQLRPTFAKLPEGTHPLKVFCEACEGALGLSRYDLLTVWKSNYLYRRLYLHQRHRINPCPLCKGRWGVGGLFANDGQGCLTCGSTGWLP